MVLLPVREFRYCNFERNYLKKKSLLVTFLVIPALLTAGSPKNVAELEESELFGWAL
jgi:hypothetical protein